MCVRRRFDTLGPRLSTLASTAPLAVTGSERMEGSMYNWRVSAVHHALAKAGKAEGPLALTDLTALGHLDQVRLALLTAARAFCDCACGCACG